MCAKGGTVGLYLELCHQTDVLSVIVVHVCSEYWAQCECSKCELSHVLREQYSIVRVDSQTGIGIYV